MSDGRELTVRLVSAGDLLGGSDDEDDELEKLLRTCDDGLKELLRSACQDWGMSMDALSSLLGAFPSDEEVEVDDVGDPDDPNSMAHLLSRKSTCP